MQFPPSLPISVYLQAQPYVNPENDYGSMRAVPFASFQEFKTAGNSGVISHAFKTVI